MSTDQPTLEDYAADPEPVAGQTPTDDLSCFAPDGDCRNCGADVSDEVLRVVGDNDGRVPGCARCVIDRTGNRFVSTASTLNSLRHGTAEVIDP